VGRKEALDPGSLTGGDNNVWLTFSFSFSLSLAWVITCLRRIVGQISQTMETLELESFVSWCFGLHRWTHWSFHNNTSSQVTQTTYGALTILPFTRPPPNQSSLCSMPKTMKLKKWLFVFLLCVCVPSKL
jgi:hypothetical protein